MTWEQLIDILAEGRDLAANPPPTVACPKDGTPLDDRDHCRWCGWQPGQDL